MKKKKKTTRSKKRGKRRAERSEEAYTKVENIQTEDSLHCINSSGKVLMSNAEALAKKGKESNNGSQTF